jgi:predicted ATPase
MHLTGVTLHPERYPQTERYPFGLPLLRSTREIPLARPVTAFVGENGTGKSTLLRAIARRAGIHIWQYEGGRRVEHNPFEERLAEFVDVQWSDGPTPGSYFASDLFHDFAELLDEWAATDPGLLRHFGGHSLLTLSHGQSLMAYFGARYQKRGLYFLDEPETALSPRRQLELVRLIEEMAALGHAQFLVATHSPALVNRLAAEELIVCERDVETGLARIPAISAAEVKRMCSQSDLRLGELWFSGTLGGVPR